jgi:UDP-3-O-[3-hydroxymyristoyl] N-acetylglucosamine deacetylase/3-hydroxyacyl-[acyl-carrier-protein] dehydratase
MAQTGGILLLNSLPNYEEKLVYFMQINNAKFRKTVLPGDQLFLEVELTSRKSKVFLMKGKAVVNDQLVAEAEFMAGVVDRDVKKNNGKE